MKVCLKKAWRPRNLLVLAPLVLMIALFVAASGPISTGAASWAYTSLPSIPPPVPGFWAAPTPPAFAQIDTTADVDALLANNANHGNTGTTPNVHLIDVRSSFEYINDVCPMQIALGLPLYTVTDVGHPVWNWPDGTHEEAYSDGYWIGFYWAGSPIGTPGGSPFNLRMEENPNYGQYLNALVADGSIKKNDKLIFVCETGYRASWAAAEATTLGFTDAEVLYGGMLAWEDDYWPQTLYDYNNPTTDNCLNLSTDPTPGDCATDNTKGGEPQNVAGPNARAKTTTLSHPWEYDTTRLTNAGYTPYWDGTEPHVAVKPEWMDGMGAGDFQLSPSEVSASWASLSDYSAGLLSVTFGMTNNAPAPPDSLNYPSACGGAPPPAGSCEQVYQNQWGPAYNSQIVEAPSTSGVTVATTLPATVGAGTINTGATGDVTLKFNVPTGVTYFVTNLFATATDTPDPAATYGASNAWYGVYNYPGPKP